jgi:hypothetical protein
MRREMILVAGVLALAVGCGKGGMFSAHSNTVATAAGQELTTEKLATFLTSNKNTKSNLTPEAVDFVANLWVDYTLYAQALATNKLTKDSSLVAEAMWPMIAERQATQWRDSLVARRVKVTDASIDSAYKAGGMRVGQHILIRVDSGATPAQKAAAKKTADGLLAKIKSGSSFGALAIANSQDPSSAADSGMMAPMAKGQFVAKFDNVLWALKPGEMSGVVETEFGFHIIRYPTEAEAASHWRTSLAASGSTAVEQGYFADLEKNANLKVQAGSVARMRAALADLEGKRKDNSELVTWKGGAFTVADFIRWVKAATTDPMQGPQLLTKITSAPDSQFTVFAKQLGQNSLLLADAEKNKITMSPADWKALQEGFQAELDSIQFNMAIGPEVLDAKASNSDRSKAAALKVDTYFDNLVKGQARLRFLPGMLAWTLRGRMDHKINAAGSKLALEMAQAKLAADSTSQMAPKQPGGVVTPAPGGAPIPGDNGAPVGPPAGKPATGGTKKP